MGRLVLVSNRLPITVHLAEEGFRFEKSIGGLASGLGAFYKSHDSLWIGWPGIDGGEASASAAKITAALEKERCHPVFISRAEIDGFYDGFCNATIWPLFHYLPLYTAYDQNWWEAYERVNRLYADAIAEVIRPDDLVWVHDYHLMLLPAMLRRRFPRLRIGFFLHIPFPCFQIFRALPWRDEILDGLLGADLVGFHTHDYERHFLESVRRLMGCRVTLRRITIGDHVTRLGTFPMGIPYERYASAVSLPEVRAKMEEFRRTAGDRRVILSVDRLDYTKGIPQRLRAFNRFLEQNPEYAQKVVLICVVVPSRVTVDKYARLKNEIDELVGFINGKHSTIGRVPIWYLFRALDFESLVALYHMADVALVTPIRDGMNLIAKEYLATKTHGKGVLILTETAGAAEELGEAIILNPNHLQRMASAIKEALEMPETEQIRRNRAMQERLQKYDVIRWAEDFLDTLTQSVGQSKMTTQPLGGEVRRRLLADLKRANRALFLLDYDGTLVPFEEIPERAAPDETLLALLRKLSAAPGSEVVIVSGRDRDTLERWFGGLPVGLVAEHGAWIKENGREWRMTAMVDTSWKEEVRPIMELWCDRIPGSFVEEKEFSLAWHYRKVAARTAESTAIKALMCHLGHIVADYGVQVLPGNRVIEVKPGGIDKGRAAYHWVAKGGWDAIVATGDDWTDESMFSALPPGAWSIKVGRDVSAAAYRVRSLHEVVTLLESIADLEAEGAGSDPEPRRDRAADPWLER